jgi:hypothetical protein
MVEPRPDNGRLETLRGGEGYKIVVSLSCYLMARGRPVLDDIAGGLLNHHGRWYIRSAGASTYTCGTRAVQEGIMPRLRSSSFDHKALVWHWFTQERRPYARPPVQHASSLDHSGP